MSLPPTTKDISAHPAKGSVVSPTDKATKDADVDRKIRLYGVITAFRNGKMPSNAQIDSTLQYVLDHSPVKTDKLSSEGKKLVDDTREIISTARLIVQEKNADELFQQFVWNTRDVDVDSIKRGSGEVGDKLPADANKARADSDEAVKHLRTLLTLILSNSEVRKLLADFSLIGRDLLSIGASKLAAGIAPSPERLQNVDHPGPDNQFITEGGRQAGLNETPVLEARLPGTDARVRQHPEDDQPQVAMHAEDTPRPAGEVRNQAKDRAAPVASQAADAAQSQVQEIKDSDTPEDAEVKKRGMKERMRHLRDSVRGGISDRVPQQHKDNADGVRRFLNDEYFPEERRDQFIFRMKKVIIECQQHDDYQNSIYWLLEHFEEYAKHGHTTAGLGKKHAGDAFQTSNLTKSISELRTLLERFANGTSLDIITDAVDALVDDAKRDKDLRNWFETLDIYIRKVLLDPGYVLDPDCNDHTNRLRDTGKQFYDDKYREHFTNLFGSVGDLFKAMGQDSLNKQFGEDLSRLTRDLLFDSEGNLTFKPALWKDIRKVILPTLIDQVGYVPIPRIEYSDDSLDLVLENLTLQGRNLFPNIVQLEAHNLFRFSPYDAIAAGDENSHRVKFGLEGIQADMRDVAFYYRKKTGIPRMRDSGMADVVLGGGGLSATVELVSTRKDPTSVFKVANVHVKVDTLKFAIRDSSHDWLYKTLRPLATGLIKRQIERAVTDALRTGLEYVDGQLVGVRQRMEKEEGQTRTGVLKGLFAKKEDTAASDTASAHTTSKSANSSKHSQFKIVSDKRKSLLVEQGHPVGWINRTAEKDKMTEEGREWRSDAFTII